MKYPHYIQHDHMDCGPTCIRMVAKYYECEVSIEKLRVLSETTKEGTNLMSLSEAAEKIGFRTLAVKINFNQLKEDVLLPCIVHWKSNHFVVVYKISQNKVVIADPGCGLITFTVDEFIKLWIGKNADEKTEEGIVLVLEPTNLLFENKETASTENYFSKFNSGFLKNYLTPYKKNIYQLFLGLIAGSVLQLLFPFLTQSIVDIGIQNRDLNFIYIILFAQLFLFIGRVSLDFIRTWILLFLGARMNISIVSDFFSKLMKLPISYFDIKMTGDVFQRISDHQRIEEFFNSTSLNILFSFINLLIFSTVLFFYNSTIALTFLFLSIINVVWVSAFMKKRNVLDYQKFNQLAQSQNKVIEIISGMQEIKLNNAEKEQRWEWEYLQAIMYKTKIKAAKIEQFQNIGASCINEFKNIVITIIAANLVIKGELTLGMLLSISYIIGQLNIPLTQLVSFFQSAQNAKISFDRLAEIHTREEETDRDDLVKNNYKNESDTSNNIQIKDVSFRYPGVKDYVISNISLTIPENKITAIVGASGSGKTTLMKIILKFYSPQSGEISCGNININHIPHAQWRKHCGVVLQDGFIFSDSIAYNITIGNEKIDTHKLRKAVSIANIGDFIDSLPLKYNTKIGADGIGLSGGQKQRVLIARAIYKDPSIIFFDEATSSLDASNENTVMKNLHAYLKGKTAVIIAHRLSTVKNADQIIVLDKGKVVETGNHESLIEKRGVYFNLVKDQIDLERLDEIKMC